MLTAASLTNWEQQQLALAAMVQCARLVQDLAVHGEAPQTQLAACINPLLQMEPDSIDDVYSEVSDLTTGLKTIQDMFGSDRIASLGEVIRYTHGIILLRSQLMANAQMQDVLRRRLQHLDPLPRQLADLGDEESSAYSHQQRILQQLANLYQDTISTLTFRIQVQGKIDNLKNERIANSIRALLLAGIRSAVLWFQLGGRRWRLVVHRKRIRETALSIRRRLIVPVQE